MNISIAFILILGFILVYDFLIRIYTVLFRITGLTKVKSRFQAISLLTNSGYTTSEAEVVTTNKMRRNIATASMITGYVFSVIIVSLVFNLINTLSVSSIQENYIPVIIILASFAFIFIFFKLPFMKKASEKIIEKVARKIMKKDINDNTIVMLDVYGKETIAEISINVVPQIFEEKKLFEINSRDLYNLNILLLKRDGIALTPNKETIIEKNDTIIVFGPIQSIKKLFITKKDKKAEE